MAVHIEQAGPVYTVILDRPEVRNAVDVHTAQALADAFRAFDAEESAAVGVLFGANGQFCPGADMKAIASGTPNRIDDDGDAPMGPSRMLVSKPVIAAIEGHAVAGGLELALWCDLRVAAEDAILGVYCRRFGVPLIDGGTVRLPRLIGMGHAMDLILSGRGVRAEEARSMGLVNRVVPAGSAREAAETLAQQLAAFPQTTMRQDRLSAYEQADLDFDAAMRNEFRHGMVSLEADTLAGAQRFARGAGRHGSFEP